MVSALHTGLDSCRIRHLFYAIKKTLHSFIIRLFIERDRIRIIQRASIAQALDLFNSFGDLLNPLLLITKCLQRSVRYSSFSMHKTLTTRRLSRCYKQAFPYFAVIGQTKNLSISRIRCVRLEFGSWICCVVLAEVVKRKMEKRILEKNGIKASQSQRSIIYFDKEPFLK